MVTFEISVSDQRFDKKPNKKSYSKLTFHKQSICIADFVDYIQDGRFMCGLFTKNIFGISDKSNNNYVGTYVVPIDVDDSDISMDDFIQTLQVKPTIAYETFSNLEEGKGYRFRLLYVFDQMVVGSDNYIMLYNAIVKCNGIASYVDDSMRKYSQGYWGTGADKSVNVYGTLHCIASFIDFMEETHVDKKRSVNSLIYTHTYVKRVGGPLFKDKDFEEQWHCDGNVSLFLKNFLRYNTSERTLIEHEEGNLWTPTDDVDYYMIKRQWSNVDGRIRPKRLRYGQHRKHKIFLSLIRRRLIDPTIEYEHLCYAALYELHYYIDNSDPDHKITKQDLANIASKALRANLDNYRDCLVCDKHFEINRQECTRQNITVQKAVGIANGEIRHQRAVELYKELAEFYDPELKRKDNIKNFQDNGYEVSLSKYKRFKKWYNNEYKNEKDMEKQHYDYPSFEEEESKELLRENNEMLKELLSYVKPEKEKTREEAFLEFFNSKNLVGS